VAADEGEVGDADRKPDQHPGHAAPAPGGMQGLGSTRLRA
jgi:hypothetical protein